MSEGFHLEEYRALRSEIIEIIKTIRAFELVCASGVAAVYAWLGTRENANSFGMLVWFSPSLFPLLGAIASWSHSRHLLDMAKYIRRIEKKFATTGIDGWEHRLAEIREQKLRISIHVTAYLFWAILLIFTLIFPALKNF